MKKTYDTKCYALAAEFLEDEPGKNTPENRHQLAIVIQQAIEEELPILPDGHYPQKG